MRSHPAKGRKDGQRRRRSQHGAGLCRRRLAGRETVVYAAMRTPFGRQLFGFIPQSLADLLLVGWAVAVDVCRRWIPEIGGLPIR